VAAIISAAGPKTSVPLLRAMASDVCAAAATEMTAGNLAMLIAWDDDQRAKEDADGGRVVCSVACRSLVSPVRVSQ
jgi:hypothetical protein